MDGRGEKKKRRGGLQEGKRRGRDTQTKFSHYTQTSRFENGSRKPRDDELVRRFNLEKRRKPAFATLNTRLPHSGHPNDRIARSSRRSKDGALVCVADSITAAGSGGGNERRPFLEGVRKLRAFGTKGKDVVRAKRRGQLPFFIIPIKEGFSINQINTFNPISKE